jgi:uncharacterized membrane protein
MLPMTLSGRDQPGKIMADASPTPDTEVVILGSIGEYVAFGDVVSEIATTSGKDLSRLEPVVRNALALEEQRDLDSDPAFGIEQLAMIGWTSISTAKSNPSPGLLTILNLRDLLAQWVQSDDAFARGGDSGADSTGVRGVLRQSPRSVDTWLATLRFDRSPEPIEWVWTSTSIVTCATPR